jgi:hypothetical protein
MMARAIFWGRLLAVVGLILTSSAFGQSPSEAAKTDACHDALPAEVSRTLSEQFGGWIVQSPDRLTSSARDRWQAEKPLGCPGIAEGRFTSVNRTSFAVLVVGSGDNQGAGKLLSFVRSGAGYHADVLEQISSGANNYFIHAAKTSQFFDGSSAGRFRVAASDAIVLFDAGTEEYGVEVHFWTGAGFRHEPVDD